MSSVSLAGWFNPSFHHMSLLTLLVLGYWSLETYQRALTQFFYLHHFSQSSQLYSKWDCKDWYNSKYFFDCLVAQELVVAMGASRGTWTET